jgi:hypothetical protein
MSKEDARMMKEVIIAMQRDLRKMATAFVKDGSDEMAKTALEANCLVA